MNDENEILEHELIAISEHFSGETLTSFRHVADSNLLYQMLAFTLS